MLSREVFKRGEVENLNRLATDADDSGLLPTAQLAVYGPQGCSGQLA
jgi:hypothetical protein